VTATHGTAGFCELVSTEPPRPHGVVTIDSVVKLHLGASVDASNLVEAMPDREFQRATRSTLALLAWWKDLAHVEALIDSMGWALPPEATARFESPERAGCKRCNGGARHRSRT
jgi:hypothetical protein